MDKAPEASKGIGYRITDGRWGFQVFELEICDFTWLIIQLILHDRIEI